MIIQAGRIPLRNIVTYKDINLIVKEYSNEGNKNLLPKGIRYSLRTTFVELITKGFNLTQIEKKPSPDTVYILDKKYKIYSIETISHFKCYVKDGISVSNKNKILSVSNPNDITYLEAMYGVPIKNASGHTIEIRFDWDRFSKEYGGIEIDNIDNINLYKKNIIHWYNSFQFPSGYIWNTAIIKKVKHIDLKKMKIKDFSTPQISGRKIKIE